MESKTFWDACSDLNAPLFKTYAVIHHLCNNDIGYCFAKNKTISEKMNKISISRDISELINLGYLYSIEIKKGYIVLERRLYTIEQYKLYLEDLANIDNLVPTTYKEKEGIRLFSNERYLDGIKISTSTKNNTINDTVNKNVNGTVNNSVNGTVNKNVKYNLYNNKLYNNKPTCEVGGVDLELEKVKNILEQYGFAFDVKIRILTLIAEKNIPLDRVFKVLEVAPLKNWGEGAIYKALENNWNIETTTSEQEERKKANEIAERKYQKSLVESENLKKQKEKILNEQKEQEELLSIFNSMPTEERSAIEKKANKIAVERYGITTAKFMTKIVIYELLREKELLSWKEKR